MRKRRENKKRKEEITRQMKKICQIFFQFLSFSQRLSLFLLETTIYHGNWKEGTEEEIKHERGQRNDERIDKQRKEEEITHKKL